MSRLDAWVEAARELQFILGEETMVEVTDTEKFLVYLKLALQTTAVTNNVTSSLQAITDNIGTLADKVGRIKKSSAEQAGLVTHFSALVEDLNALSGEMNGFMETIFKK
jgi:methyl-accepting chemotaxis protein